MEEEDVKREARALVTEECASTSDASENTMDVADDLAFNISFDGSPESFARAPLNIETMKQVLENVNTVNFADADRNIINQVFQDAMAKITSKVVTTVRKKRKSRRYDRFDERTTRDEQHAIRTLPWSRKIYSRFAVNGAHVAPLSAAEGKKFHILPFSELTFSRDCSRD